MLQEGALSRFKDWYDGEKRGKGSVPKGTIAGALVVLDSLKNTYDLFLAGHLTSGGGQIKNASGENIKRILSEFGETRHFVAEGGRTNRGLLQAIGEMLKTLAVLKLEQLSEGERNAILEEFQVFLVEQVKEFHIPNNRLIGVRQNIELMPVGKGRIAAESIESFVSYNIDELSRFSSDKLARGLCDLLEEYNSRIDEAEVDKSLMVEIPQNLLRSSENA